jgi:hypothetical protein
LANSIGDQLVAKRKSEKFRRIKCSTLGKLLTEQNFDESIYKLNEGEEESKAPSMMVRDRLTSLVGPPVGD